MRASRITLALLVVGLLQSAGSAGVPGLPDSLSRPQSRPGFSGGMGVSYIGAPDLVNLVNATRGSTSRESEFSSVVEFFGAVSIPLSGPWGIKMDYGYVVGSYTVQGFLEQSEYAYAAHMPTLLLQYVMVEAGVYNFKAGLGPGYYFGALTQRQGGTELRYTGTGAGLLLYLEANTALGDDLFANLGVVVRWSGIGALTSENGMSPQSSSAAETTLQFFGVGARLGFSYYL